MNGHVRGRSPRTTCTVSPAANGVGRSAVEAGMYNPYTPALAPELGRAYAAQRRRATNEGDINLRDITIALVRRLKNEGLPPERVLVAVKGAIVRYGDDHRPPSLASEDERPVAAGDVYERLFRCFLDTYFSAGE